MYTPVFEGKEYGYCVDKDTDEYMLFSDKYEVCMPLNGKDAKVFGSHIQLLKNENDDTVNERIEKVICIEPVFFHVKRDRQHKGYDTNFQRINKAARHPSGRLFSASYQNN